LAQASDKQLRQIVIFVCLVASSLLVAHSINAFVADTLNPAPELLATSHIPDSPGSALAVSYSPAQYAEDLRTSGLFVLPPPPQEPRNQSGPAGPAGAPVRASLGAAAKIRLIGVVMGEQRGVFAIVEEQTSKNQALYRLHDRIPDLGEVTDIQRNSIVIRQGNLEELVGLSLPDKPFAPGNSASTPPSPALSASRTPAASPLLKQVVDRREVEQAMNDLPKLMTQARAVPNMVNGAINGFRLDYIAPSSFYEKIGVQTGDVLQRVNGVDIRDPGTILSLLQQLKNEEVVKLDIIRNNQRSTVTYELR
jgi:general secretion pathway protein C